MGNAKRRVRAKRKRQFRGNGSTIKHSKNSSATSTNASSSKIKMPAVFDEEIAEYQLLHPTKNKIVECGISVDGTWQRRGYSSMNGCVAALSVDTGKVVDIEIYIMSSYCPTSRKISKMPRSIESETFAADNVCHSNFQGSALKMEAVGATRIFQRSIVKRGLKYAHYYGDGDSKGFISVKDTYGKDSVTKYECIVLGFMYATRWRYLNYKVCTIIYAGEVKNNDWKEAVRAIRSMLAILFIYNVL
ncbi:uncharacterized protein TNCV_1283821 [Trichonephila clavipes]|uniref:Mutator-like transposase domain-containing protein n=1 Tax=Trichonephila clavipes TaxID=2585209 RepID=A0A8X6SL30_TRICX|nr:uncharacterized protein TNCV_1283821 [Trichonephila clavipes]